MLKLLKRFDEGIARGEAALAMFWLLAMIVAGATQAFFRFCATRVEAAWANPILQSLDWVDPLLQKGTLWLAFLGASLATREGRHIAIDILQRVAPRKPKLLMRGAVGLAAGTVAIVLALAFWSQVEDIAVEASAYTIYTNTGSAHVCDATPEQLGETEVSSVFCGMRSAFRVIGVPLENPQAALQFIIPVMFIVIGIRLFANAAGSFLALGKPAPEPEAHSAEAAEGEEG